MTTNLETSITNLRNALKAKTKLGTEDFMSALRDSNDLYDKYTGLHEYISQMPEDNRVILALLCLASEGIYY